MNWQIFMTFLAVYLVGYAVCSYVQHRRRFRHPAWSKVPPGHCPVCKATPDQDCDISLHS